MNSTDLQKLADDIYAICIKSKAKQKECTDDLYDEFELLNKELFSAFSTLRDAATSLKLIEEKGETL